MAEKGEKLTENEVIERIFQVAGDSLVNMAAGIGKLDEINKTVIEGVESYRKNDQQFGLNKSSSLKIIGSTVQDTEKLINKVHERSKPFLINLINYMLSL